MTALQVFDPGAGELVRAVDAQALLAAGGIPDPAEAETTELAAFDENARTLADIAKEARGIVGDELVHRLDMDRCWTLHEGEWTITAPSPEAGTVGYDAEALHAVLSAAVEAKTISQTAMNAAVKDVTPGPQVSWDLLNDIYQTLLGEVPFSTDEAIRQDVTTLLAAEPERVHAVLLAGVNRLLKGGGSVAEAIEGCRVSVTPPRRQAKVKRSAKP
jgi:hypothetical protein